MRPRNYRRLLGLLLVWAAAPLPFLYIVMPPFWLIAGSVGLFLILRPRVDLKFSRTALNLIGIAILVAVVMAGGLRVGPLRPLGHLLLLLTSVRAVAVTDRRTFLRALLLVFLVWVVSVTSSTHVTVVLYFAASAGLWWWAGMRILLAGIADGDVRFVASFPRPRHVAVAALAALLLAVPLFLAMPRLRSPWVAGRGGMSSVTGFSSHVNLAGVGPIRRSQEIALVVRSVSGQPLKPEWMRLRATAFERVTLDSWAPRRADRMPEMRQGVAWLHRDNPRLDEAVELEVELMRPRRYLFLPPGTVALAAPVDVRLDPAGGVRLATRVHSPLRYTVWVRPGVLLPATDEPLRRRQRFQPHPDVRQLGRDIVAGLRTDRGRAEAVEAYLQNNFAYSMSGMSRMGPDPVAWFLLHERAGHCEYFAGAMVALLTDLGIPARVVGGYSGGALVASDREAVVREANAHTWVEAWVGEEDSWSVFDPTPAGEVPALNRPTNRERFQWAWQWTQSSWDRYLLTFGLGEQIQLITAVAEGAGGLARGFEWRQLLWLAVVAAAVTLGRRYWRRTPAAASRRISGRSTPAAAVMAKIERRLERAGVGVPQHATVRWIAGEARGRWPGSGAPVGELAWLAEQELYAEGGGFSVDQVAIRRLWT
ncbi:MAG: transglutaminaseTgpA domain-containing protein, partial [Thermoanaerobaculales bacterium]